MIRLAAAGLFLLVTAQFALAATEVKQTVTTQFGKKTFTSTHTWMIDKGKFTLDVKSANGGARYIFNGRTFYICSALNQAQIKFLNDNNVKDAKLIERFRKGACQTVPSNFIARFFLAPADAVESIDFSDGLKLSLGFKDYQVSTAGAQKIAGSPCTNMKRNYTLTKKANDSNLEVAATSTGEICEIKAIEWRKNLWQEVAKVVLRQPGGGGSFYSELRKDHKAIKGLIGGATTHMKSTASNGQSVSMVRTLATQSIKKKRPKRKQFSIPAGYSVFSPENIELATLKSDKKDPKKKKKSDAVNSVTSVFFCAISSGFGCFNF